MAPETKLGQRLAVNLFRGVNQEQAAIVGRPGAILDIFASFENGFRPRLADAEAFHFHAAPP